MKISILHFDGARNKQKASYGVVLEYDDKTYKTNGILSEPCTNNQAEYQALLNGLDLYYDLGLENYHLVIKGDSKLVICQVNDLWKVEHPNMIPLYQRVKSLLPNSYSLVWIPREENEEADRLASLAE